MPTSCPPLTPAAPELDAPAGLRRMTVHCAWTGTATKTDANPATPAIADRTVGYRTIILAMVPIKGAQTPEHMTRFVPRLRNFAEVPDRVRTGREGVVVVGHPSGWDLLKRAADDAHPKLRDAVNRLHMRFLWKTE